MRGKPNPPASHQGGGRPGESRTGSIGGPVTESRRKWLARRYRAMSEGACPFPSADTSPRGRERTHPDRVSVVRNEVTPSGPGVASRGAARRTDARAGTGSPKKRMLPAARRRATGQLGYYPTRKGADVGEAPAGGNGRRSSHCRRKLDAACGPANGAGGEISRRLEVRTTHRGAGSRVLGNLHARI